MSHLTLAQSADKPRLIVLTDISSLTQGEGEPDDGQSLTRLMLYTNEMDLEGLIATSNLRHGQRTRPDLIRKVVDAYAQVQPNLLMHDKHYPDAKRLSAIIKQGQPIAGPKVPVDQSIGENKDTEGSDHIIYVVDKKDPRPVWVTIWGGSADLAQALWKVKASRSPDQLKEFVKKLRVHFIYDQDQTGPWIRTEFPELYCIFRHHGIRGMYRGGDTTLVRTSWVQNNIRNHGALGDLYVNYKGGDIWAGKLGKVNGIKEGDTPSLLFLMTNGLNSHENPQWGNWGGRFQKDPTQKNVWIEAVDSVADYASDMDPRMAALYRWRPAWQSDFAARLDWCVKPYKGANHHPKIMSNKNKLTVKSGQQVKLSLKASDPDKDKLLYHWFFYPEEDTYWGELPKLSTNGSTATFNAPSLSEERTLHVIAEVADNGVPALRSYHRYIIEVKPATHD